MIKYPRTVHLPSSPGATNDDKIIRNMDAFIGEEIVITEKVDGENTTIYSNGRCHARSIDSRSHESRNWIKQFAASIAHNIPEDWRICGENLYAQHTLPYNDLLSYFYGFSVWDEKNDCISWDNTTYVFGEVGVIAVPVLYRGPFQMSLVTEIINELDLTTQEGIVMRVSRRFPFSEFSKRVAKWVRKDHVMTDVHWMHKEVTPNKLRNTL